MKPENTSEIRRALDENLAVPLWPTAGRALDLRRGATYAAAARGDIKTIQLGRLKRVPSAWLKAKLGLDGRRLDCRQKMPGREGPGKFKGRKHWNVYPRAVVGAT